MCVGGKVICKCEGEVITESFLKLDPGVEVTANVEEEEESVFGYESSLKIAMIVGAFILIAVVFILAGVGFYQKCSKGPDP